MSKLLQIEKLSPIGMFESHVAELSELDLSQLRDEFAKAMIVTVGGVIRLAAIVRVLEDRGEDVSDIQFGHMLRRVACGQVLPELVVKLQWQPRLLNKVAMLPIADQRTVAEDRPIKVATVENGARTHRMVRLMQMSPDEVRRVFAKDHIRDVGEQVSMMESEAATERHVNRPPVTIDPRRKGIVVTGEKVFISFKELTSHLASLSS